MKPERILLILMLGLSWGVASGAGADRAEVEAFFQTYMELADGYDPKLAEVYSDGAEIRMSRREADGRRRSMTLTGVQWKAVIQQAMPLAKMRGDRSFYRNIQISVEGARARIKADRTSVLKCYTDTSYSMVVERQAVGGYLIVEEYSETQASSDC